jgi:hypothetical protein
MFQILIKSPERFPENGSLRVEAHFAQEISVSPVQARRKAAGYLATEVSMAIRAGEPILIAGQQPVWRVPVHLHLPGSGDDLVPIIGSVDVDAVTANVIPLTPDQIFSLQSQTDAFAASSSLSPA